MASTPGTDDCDMPPDVGDSSRRRAPFGFDPTSIDLTDVDLVSAFRQATAASDSLTSRAVGVARDATYVAVGLGLLTYQRAQVRRRELERARRR